MRQARVRGSLSNCLGAIRNLGLYSRSFGQLNYAVQGKSRLDAQWCEMLSMFVNLEQLVCGEARLSRRGASYQNIKDCLKDIEEILKA
jgi:hypothetical protein